MSGSRILLIGAGAVGLVFASHILNNTQNVSLVILARSNYKVIRDKGFTINYPESDPPVTARYHVSHILEWSDETLLNYNDEPFDMVIISTKSLATEALPNLDRLMSPEKTLLILFQNGIEIERPYLERYPTIPLASAVIRVAASSDSLNAATVLPGGLRIDIGLLKRFKDTPGCAEKLKLLESLCKEGNIARFDIVENIQVARWEKLLWNGSFNTVAAIVDKEVGPLINSKLQLVIRKLMIEIWTVADAVLKSQGEEGWPSVSRVDELIEWTRNKVPANFVPSTLQDVRKNKPIESEAILGNVVRAAERENIKLSTIPAINSMLKSVNERILFIDKYLKI